MPKLLTTTWSKPIVRQTEAGVEYRSWKRGQFIVVQGMAKGLPPKFSCWQWKNLYDTIDDRDLSDYNKLAEFKTLNAAQLHCDRLERDDIRKELGHKIRGEA